MNKKIITGLIVLMGISILGIIMVQLVWIGNAIQIKNELFDRNVIEALESTSARLDNMRDVQIISNISLNDSICNKEHINHQTSSYFQIIPDQNKAKRRNIKLFFESGKYGEMSLRSVEQDDTLFDKSDGNIQISAEIKDIDSLYKKGISQVDSLVSAITGIDVVVSDISKKVEEKAVRLKQVAHKVVTEMYSGETEEPDIANITHLLNEKLREKKIPIKFEMGIIKDSTITAHSEKADSMKLLRSPYKTSLFPNNIIQKNMLLAMYFPEKEGFIYRSIGWLLISSLVLSIIVLVTFAVSVFYILKQKKVSEMKSDFINNMTHEFKTPIATIAVATDSISNEKVIGEPDKIRYFLGMIKKENTRMNHQVEDILTIARLDKKEFEFKWELQNIHELIEDSVHGIIIQVENKGGKIETFFQADKPVVTCDKTHFTNVVYNLLDNAMKYSTNIPEIKLSTKNSSDGVLISVEDNGIGMSKAVQSKIFERFYRLSTGNIHNVKGFGLGLSYSKAVIEANNGTITVKSEPGKGSRFDVFLPFSRD